MVKNSLKSSIGTYGKTRLLLDELISVGDNIEHLSISHRDKLICIHEKSHFYQNCNRARGIDTENIKKRLEERGFYWNRTERSKLNVP
jgi:hypothetical protein